MSFKASVHTAFITRVSSEAKALIERFEEKLSNNLKVQQESGGYNSIDDILTRKYKLSDIDNMDFPDLRNKTEFITKSVRGNLSKAEGKILTYKEAEDIIDKGLNADLP